MKKRHSWGKLEKLTMTEQQQCEKCGLFRFKWCNIWLYSKDKTTEEQPFAITIPNEGCGK